MRLALTAVAALALAACNVDLAQADGGRARLHCTNSIARVPVKVVDATGAPAEAADVRATNASTGESQGGPTDGQGVFVITEAVGAGTVWVDVYRGAFTAHRGTVTFTCGDCDCTVSPRELLLTLGR